MDRAPALTDRHPSIVVDGRLYHYGKSAADHGYIVENAQYAKDYWRFETETDLLAFLVNLPDSVFLAHDRAKQRELAEARVNAGTAPAYIMDLEGKHGPYAPRQIQPRADAEPPLERLARQLRQHAREFEGLNDAGKLRVLEGEIDWSGISNDDKRVVLTREVDFAKISSEQFASVYEDIAMDDEMPAAATVATRLFVEAINAEQRADYDAARVRDYGEADAATYEDRVREGALLMTAEDSQPTPAVTAEYREYVWRPGDYPTPGEIAESNAPNARDNDQGRDHEPDLGY